jgi:hypothetical protein
VQTTPRDGPASKQGHRVGRKEEMAVEELTNVAAHGRRLGTSVMTDAIGGDDYSLRVLIERMEQSGSSEREIEVAVRETSGCPARPRRGHWTARRRPPFRVLGRRLRSRGLIGKREEGRR